MTAQASFAHVMLKRPRAASAFTANVDRQIAVRAGRLRNTNHKGGRGEGFGQGCIRSMTALVWPTLSLTIASRRFSRAAADSGVVFAALFLAARLAACRAR